MTLYNFLKQYQIAFSQHSLFPNTFTQIIRLLVRATFLVIRLANSENLDPDDFFTRNPAQLIRVHRRRKMERLVPRQC